VQAAPEAIIKKRTCHRGLYPKIAVLPKPSFNAGDIDIPFLNSLRFKEVLQLIKLL
jgi:hypothetical protein